VCRVDRACAERCQADSEPDGPEERARWPGVAGGMALAHRRNAPFSIPIFLKDMREEFNSLNASNHFAGCNERISTKRLESERCQIARRIRSRS
jgi:hypothetical protein